MKTVATHAEFEQVIASEHLVVVDFFATWCGPCKQIGPTVEKWAEEFTDVIFVKVDVDENDETAEQCKVTAMPTFQLYKKGKLLESIIGPNKDKIREAIVANK
jgi:thioredoxin 1